MILKTRDRQAIDLNGRLSIGKARQVTIDISPVVEKWMENVSDDARREIVRMSDEGDALLDAFYRDLKFGTGGLRGIIGMGPNRMNVYSVGKATQGLADYLNSASSEPSVAVAHDSRHMGEEFVREAAEVLAANGIKVFVFPRLEPTPLLSFAVRELGCTAGICITASHNPAPYNGYKVYGFDGCQITTHIAKQIQVAIDAVDTFADVRHLRLERAAELGLISYIDDKIIHRYVDGIIEQGKSLREDAPISLVYTPLHGTGLECVSRMLEGIGIGEVYLEPSQVVPDGDFPTCPRPNPEIPEALNLGLALCESKEADLLLATDPDADRVGVAVSTSKGYRTLTGNEIGILLVDYLANKQIVPKPIVLTTIVSSSMVDAMARPLGFELRRTLTGFKFIGEQIGLLESKGEGNRFLLGFEESYGYLAGTRVRDKDAVVACMLVCQMARHYKARGLNLLQAIERLYDEYGYFKSSQISIDYPGANGESKMAAIMKSLRDAPPSRIAGFSVEGIVDYSSGTAMPIVNGCSDDGGQILPQSDVLEFNLAMGGKLIIRPSGTEPKIKAYVFVRGDSEIQANELLDRLGAGADELLR